jgi:superfamily II DNA or RNA helicase
MQSLGKQDNIPEWIKDYGQLIVDECHHISAASFESVVRKCPAYYRLGLSATLARKDGQQPIVLMNLGEVRYAARQQSGRFIQKVIPRYTGFQLPEQGDISAFGAHDDSPTAVAATMTGIPLMLKGGMGKKQIKTIMEQIQHVPSGSNRIILATGKYLGEGFDLPCLDTLFLVFPFSWKGTLIQYVGRLNRTAYGKTEVIVYDYVDDKVPVLQRMFNRRLKGYKALGFSFCPAGSWQAG